MQTITLPTLDAVMDWTAAMNRVYEWQISPNSYQQADGQYVVLYTVNKRLSPPIDQEATLGKLAQLGNGQLGSMGLY